MSQESQPNFHKCHEEWLKELPFITARKEWERELAYREKVDRDGQAPVKEEPREHPA